MLRRVVLWLLGLAAAGVLTGAVLVVPGVKGGTLCLSCHKDQAASLNVAAHTGENCSSCHVGSGTDQILRFEPRLAAMAVSQVVGGRPSPGEGTRLVADGNCISCHEADMPWIMQDKKPGGRALVVMAKANAPTEGPGATQRTPETLGGDQLFVRADHDYHLNQLGLNCTDCHAGSAHPTLVRQDPAGHATTRTASYQEACDRCHTREQNSLNCDRCHTREALTQGFPGQEQWMNPHLMNLEQAKLTCTDCHKEPVHSAGAGGTGFMVQTRTGIAPTDAADPSKARRTQLYEAADCSRCHSDPNSEAYRKNLSRLPEAPPDDQCRDCHEDPDRITSMSPPPPASVSSGG